MGIKSQYLGEINIPEEHRAEYAQQALKLLRAGGMVTVEPVQLYGHKPVSYTHLDVYKRQQAR